MDWAGHLLVVEIHIEVIVVGEGAAPQHSLQGQENGIVVQQEVKQILLRMEGAHHAV